MDEETRTENIATVAAPTNEITVKVERDPLAASEAELLVARTAAASVQTSGQRNASLKATTDWVEQAKALGLQVFERQPEETEKEWYVWTTYRNYYPGRMPTWTKLAAECGSTVGTVVKIATRWNFRLRMVAWSKYTDDGVSEDRMAAIKKMNEEQLLQAQILRAKVTEALDYLEPSALRPNEIATLMKLANEQERNIVEAEALKVAGQVVNSADAASDARKTDAASISEILNIMANAGALGSAILGVEKKTTTTTTERVVVNGNGGDSDE